MDHGYRPRHGLSKTRLFVSLFCVVFAIGYTAKHARAQTVYSVASPAFAQAPPPESVCRDCARPHAISPPAPPAGFNPLAATDTQLAFYGFPPRPDPAKSPGAYAVWAKVVTLPVTRIVPQLQVTNIANGPARIISVSRPVANGPTGTASKNWSGYVVQDPNNPFKTANTYIYSAFVVPIAQQAFGTCSSNWDYSSMWVGIDGWGSNDVLQAGVEADAQCSSNTTNPYYAAWYEWYPDNEVRLSNFPIAAGDVIYVYVWNTSTTSGNYYIANDTANVASSLSFSAPNGTVLQGNSVEWIVERPSINSNLATLTNYVADPWYYSHANNPSGAGYSPARAPTGTIYSVTMQVSGANVSRAFTSTNEGLTYVDPTGASAHYSGTALWFFDEGAAR